VDIIFDIDGTLMNLEHRVHFVNGLKYDQKNFEAGIKDDIPIPEMVALFDILAKHEGNRIIFCTGRREKTREATRLQIDKLTQNILSWDPKLKFPIYMRADEDRRSDPEVKSDLYDQMLADGFKPILVFEDRASVVKMWRKLGVRCLQVAEGNF
tara:strand:+ start:259 stop:720 length:462 start_codon:yes stop_codon:yes gene_type:complete